MIPLIFSIASASLIFAIFKLFDRFKIDTFQAIVVNYITAFLIGLALYSDEWNPRALEQNNWMIYALLCSLLFIGLFFVMARSSQINGVASTSIAVKMSMVVSLILMIVGYSESFTYFKLLGIIIAFMGLFLVSYEKKKGAKTSATWMLILLFFGSGALDFILNYVQKYELGVLTPSLFTAIGLGTAGVIGLGILSLKMILGRSRLEIRTIIPGILLGIPNYFSIYLLLLSYKTTGWTDSKVLAITNVSILIVSAMIGFLAFKENASNQKIIGLISAILAIGILYIAN
ncbi:MAG: EamA family transporter [Crocinitomicaceae bacterium]|nr:EamA family transporter [Crocinitomicaceae bacterium]